MLQTHLGARFVSDAPSTIARSATVTSLEQHVEIGGRLRTAISLGDVSAIQELARHLMQGTATEAAVGERIKALMTSFDFDGLNALVDSLES